MVFTQRPGRGNNNNNNGPIDNEPYISPSRAMTGPIHTPNAHQGQPGYGQQMPYGPGYPQNPHFNPQGYPPQQGAYGPQPGPYPQPQGPYFDPRQQQQPYPPQQNPYGQQQQPPQPQSQRPQRQEDLKGLSFWQEEEENSYHDDGDGGLEKSSPFKFVIVLTGLVIVSGVLWLGYRWATKSEGDIVLVQAEEGPYKVRPDQPGGVSYPHQDMLVYGRLSPNAPNAQVERMTPVDPYADQRHYQQQQQIPQEQPQQNVDANQQMVQQQPVMAPQPQQAPMQQAPQQPEMVQTVPATQQTAPVSMAQAQPVVQEQTAPAQPTVTQQTPQPLPQQPVVQEQQKPMQPVAEASKKDIKAEQPKVKVDAKSKVVAEVKTTLDAGYYMQIASLPKEDSAKKEWLRIRDDKKYAAELTDVNAYIKQSDMGIKKVYSLYVGPFSNRDVALKKCIVLTKGCKVIEVKSQ